MSHHETLPARAAGEADGTRLRILLANEDRDRLDRIASFVEDLGHEVVGRELEVAGLAALIRREQPDLAFVGLGESSEHALEMISKIVAEATCPVVAMLDGEAGEFVVEAAKRGIFGVASDDRPESLRGAIEIVVRRFVDYNGLQGAFGRRALIERAKGILMERHGIREQRAFDLLRETSRRDGRKLIEVAQGVVDNHLLLPRVASSSDGHEAA